MPKDIRELLKKDIENSVELSTNHRQRFEQKMMQELHGKSSKKVSFQWGYIAASIMLLIGLGITFYPTEKIEESVNIASEKETTELSLGSISPELKTVEAYYINTINYQISQLELTNDNKDFFDGYFAELGELTKEYKTLTRELNTKGINDNTINALIGNLQLRLQLLKRMQKQLNELKNPIQNDNQNI